MSPTSPLTLKPTESKILVAAAADGGRLTFPARLKESTRQRLAGDFVAHGLAEARDDALHLTAAGYRAVGLRPPRPAASGSGEPRVSTRDLMRDLLRRDEGASLAELTGATGWLPHTARAALSRLRSGGEALGKSKREDGTTFYRLLPPAPAVSGKAVGRAARKAQAETGAEVAA